MGAGAKMEPVMIFLTGPVNFKISAGWPASQQASQPVSDWPSRPVFLQKVFVYCSKYLMKIFQKGAWVRYDNLRLHTLVSKKKLRFLEKYLNFKTFLG